ncbi:ABC transporter ATP-binding protein [Ferrovibrio sp.]|uniref:ABC transporter ATP-binding protein n=1 Tax=Ferrovibrio sp. TaxID=1917215 RepID=UPI003D148051
MTLSASNLGIGYPTRRIAENLDVTLAPGEVVCLLGPNGIGKSTLFRTLLGLQPALDGSVTIDGSAIASMSPRDLARRIAYVPQAHAGYFPFTLRDMVLMGRTAHRGIFSGPGNQDRAVAEAAIDRLGLTHLAEAIYTRLSGGERQLALIARALAVDARLMLLDEPTANLDFGNQARVLAEIRRLAATGIGVLFTTHDPDQALAHADRVLLMGPGSLLAQGRPQEILTAESLQRLYGIEVTLVDLPLPGGGSRRVCLPLPDSGKTA